ncbi:carboxymuconolactone decarboxylase family protein [bacterium]|nr:carboxymuconolactone decarboxylase family protein [bacterium]NUN45457.1 carboxymuconolactone decarboxylase family protein [bacterium]
MLTRISIKDIEPEAYKAMMALENYTKTIGVSPLLTELIKIRASQINGCAYCIDMHTEYAIKLGESERRLFVLPAWKESHLFSDEERLVLQLTEEVTLIHAHGVQDDTYNAVVKHFGEKTTAQIIMLIVLINSWNRIAVTTKLIYK